MNIWDHYMTWMLATIHHGYPGIIWTAKREFCNFNIGLHHQTTDLDSSILLNSIQLEKNTHIDCFFRGGDLGKTLQWLQSLAGYQAVLAILGQNQTITQKAARFWSVEHYSIWQGMTQAPSVLRKRHIHGKTKIEQELFFKRQLREKWTR